MDYRKLVFVSGKGGVGKTTVSLLLARYLSLQGRKVLFVELSDQSSANSLLESSSAPSNIPRASGFGFDWCLLQGSDCLVEYVSSIVRVESLVRSFFENALIDSLLNVAPGLNDLAILGKLTSSIRGHGPGFHYDHIIIDAPSTGSFLSLLSAPRTLGESVTVGPMHTQSLDIDRVLKNEKWTQYLLVSLFEELPVDELEETLSDFESSYKQQTSIFMNKRISIEEINLPIEEWKNFIGQKISLQNQQIQRVKKFDEPLFTVDLFTTNTAFVIKNLQGSFYGTL